MKIKFLVSIALLCFFGLGDLFAQGSRLLRNPAVSSQNIVFMHADDLWVTSANGGDATRLTAAIGAEFNPQISPDGNWVAFSGQYDGNTDVFVVSIKGGEPKRLTWHPGADLVQDWSTDGKSIIFSSGREGYPTANLKFFEVNVDGGTPKALKLPFGFRGSLSPDGNYMAYQPYTFWDPEWRNYRGGQAQPIWIFNMKTNETTYTPRSDGERHTNPVWIGNKIYFLSELDFANNVWSYDIQTKVLEQITFHKDFDVKNLAAGGGMLVYEQAGYLHKLNPTTKQTNQLVINVRGDFNWSRPRFTNIPATALTNAALSPTGKRAIFESRGEIITVPKESGDWRNITQTSGAADRAPIWSPDGNKIAWFSDASGEYQLVVANQDGANQKSYAIPNKKFYFRPDWSPDGKYIAFTDTDYNLWYIDLANGNLKMVDTDRYAHPNRSMNPVWSPDSKWIAYARLLDNQFKVIKVHNISTGQTSQLTDGLSDAIDPQWDESGKYLYFLASTDFGLSTGWLDMSSYNNPVNRALYLVVLNKSDASPVAPKSDEEGAEPKPVTKGAVNVTIDFDKIDQRIIALDVPLRNYSALVAGPEGHVFYLEAIPNQQGLVMHRFSLKENKSIEFLRGVNAATNSFDRKNILYRSGNTWHIVGAAGAAPRAGDGKINTADISIKVDPQAEAKQIFREGWRFQRDFLYVDNTHGAPWEEVYTWYAPWIDHVKHRSDLNYVVDILGGEIAVGHSYTSGGDFPSVPTISGGLLGADYEIANNLFRIKKIYTGENWNPDLQSPLSGPGINVNVGDYIIEVDGKPVTASDNFFSFFEAKVNKQVRLSINSKPGMDGSRIVTVVPVGNETGLRMRDWVESNRRKVDELSGGKLAYVYVPNTGQGGFTYFNRYYFSQQNKKGAVIDERNNGGGSAADYMVDVMNRKLLGYFNSRAGDRKPFTTPMAGIWGPKVMIVNENAGSGGDLLPYMFRKLGIGPIVGKLTWGGLVGTWDTPPFIDGGRMVAPRGGFFDTDGEWAVEGDGVAPDIEVLYEPAMLIKGRDPQLERAVAEALRLLETEGIELKKEPKAPIRYKRPK